MKLIKGLFYLLLVLLMASMAYLCFVLFTAGWYPDLDMKPAYAESYFTKKAQEITRGLTTQPNSYSITLTQKEGEALLKTVVLGTPELKGTVKGVEVVFLQDVIRARANVQFFDTWKKGLELTLKPEYQKDQNEFSVKLQGFKVGKYPLPVLMLRPAFAQLNKAKTIVSYKNDRLWVNKEELPFVLQDLQVQPASLQLKAGISLQAVLNAIQGEIPLTDNLTKQGETLKKELQSTEAKELIDTIQKKGEITPSDLEKAQDIYKDLSPEDLKALQKNLETLKQNPAFQELLKKYGL